MVLGLRILHEISVYIYEYICAAISCAGRARVISRFPIQSYEILRGINVSKLTEN
jgi:hypothetical protein